MDPIDIPGTPYSYDAIQYERYESLANRVTDLRKKGTLSPQVLHRLRNYFRIKNIYHSNAIEGNSLDVGETRQVVEQGLTITGKPLKDQAEARNLSHALGYLEKLAADREEPFTEKDIRSLHSIVLEGIHESAGSYREVKVEIAGSSYKPEPPENVGSAMMELGRWLTKISCPTDKQIGSIDGFLIAAAAHTYLVTIHPFVDGNGRVARLLANLILMRFGYPIAIITKEDRYRYYDALEESQSTDLTPFTILLAECIEESLEEYERAAQEHMEQTEWAQAQVEKFSKPELVRKSNEYEVWVNAMELLKSQIKQTVDLLNNEEIIGSVRFRDFGTLEFQKYLALSGGGSAKRTWFMRIDFIRSTKTARYLFFFGRASSHVVDRCNVTLHLAREEPPKSFNYERLDGLQLGNVPDFLEVGYELHQEQFIVLRRSGMVSDIPRVEEFGRSFFSDIIQKHFRN